MLNAVIRFALRYRLLVVFTSLAALVYGGYVMATLPIDVLPDLDRPRVTILTECPGLASPEDVEALVTFPLETQLNGATGVESVRSQSGKSISVVTVNFHWGTDVYIARQIVQERLAGVELPAGIKPFLAPISSLLGQIMIVGLTRKESAHTEANNGARKQMELRTLADWNVRLQLLKIPGVAQVVTMGGGRKQYQVRVDPNALMRYQVTLAEVADAVKKNNLTASGGWVERLDRELPVRFRGRLGPTPELVIEQLKKIPVKTGGERTITLAELAKVVEAPQVKRGECGINGRPGVLLVISKQPHVDTRKLTSDVLQTLEELKPTLPDDVEVHPELFQLKRFIDLGVYNVAEALAVGGVLVIIVLFLFLLNFRTTFISLMAIPLSLAVTAIVFQGIGWISGTMLTINIMTLGGIAVAMGELVDDSIVDVENIFRRLRENNALSQPRPALTVIYEASVEIRSAIVFGTVMVILVFLPLFALPGIEGRLFAPLAVAYIVAILASLLISLTVTPVLSYYFLRRARAVRRAKESPILRLLKWGASYLVRFSMARAGILLLLSWIGVAVSAWMLMQLGTAFLPPFDEGSVQANIFLSAGSSLEASNRVCAQVNTTFDKLRKDGLIIDYVRRSGRAELDEHTEPVSNSEYILTINPNRHEGREEVLDVIRNQLTKQQLGGEVEAEQPLKHLISHMMSGVTAEIAVKIFGDDLAVLHETAEKIKEQIVKVRGVKSAVVDPLQLTEEVHVDPREDKLELYGVDKDTIAEFTNTALYGQIVSQVLQKQRRFDLVVRLEDRYRNDLPTLKRLPLIRVPANADVGEKMVPLAALTHLTIGLGPNLVKRESVRRLIVVRVITDGTDLGGVVADIKKKVRNEVSIPEGYSVDYGGQFESQQRATVRIVLLGCLAVVAMFVVLYMLYPSWRIVLQILNALPTAFIGGVIALVITGQTLNVAGMVGFISLGGIAVRNGILLVSHYLHLMEEEGEGFTPQMVLRGSLERLAPVLMTALTAGVALSLLVFAGQEPGREILYPVATVIFGGLITSTFCEFLIHPGIFWRFSGGDAQRLVERRGEGDIISMTND